MQAEELIGLWDSAPLDFGATESTRLALLPNGRGWTAVAGPAGETRVRELTWDCPKPDLIELRYTDYEFVRAHYTLGIEALHLSQHVDSARQFALSRRDVTSDYRPEAPAHERRH